MQEVLAFTPVAIVGMALRTPGALNEAASDNGEKSFANLLASGQSVFRRVPEDRWKLESDAEQFGIYTQVGTFIEKPSKFDANAFGLSTGESEALDPQQRLLLELAWHALDNAGVSRKLAARLETGVYVGSTFDDYKLIAQDIGESLEHSGSRLLGLLRCNMAGRISHALNLNGPALYLDASCATGLLCVYQACKALASGECSLALAGAVNLLLHPDSWAGLCMSGALSRAGWCRPFDDAADGYVRGEGAAVFALMPLALAEKTGMNIRGVIRGGAVNHDGASNGLTAPNGSAQEMVIKKALASGGLRPHDIGLIEAHGTGTRLGDPVEAMALDRVFADIAPHEKPISLLSVKALIGHLESAAGCAGLARLVLDSERGAVSAQAGFETPNRLIPWAKLSLSVPKKRMNWPENEHGLMCAGISSFGMSGTNVHLIFEPASPRRESIYFKPDPLAERVIPVSACDETALEAVAENIAVALTRIPAGSIARAAQATESGFRHKSAVLSSPGSQTVERLENKRSGNAISTAWMFSGQGAQYFGMASGLYKSSNEFRAIVNECSEVAEPLIKANISACLSGLGADEGTPMLDTAIVQPALYAVQAGLVSLWKKYLPAPDFMIGHSVGEIAVAHALGLLPLRDGAFLSAARGALIREYCKAPGAMLAVASAAARLDKYLEGAEETLAVASYNGASQTVLSGCEKEISRIRDELKNQGIKCSRLPVSHAFHSPLMRPAEEAFRKVLSEVDFKPAKAGSTLFLSTLSGDYAESAVLADPEYWIRHLLSPVRFEQAATTLLTEQPDILLELGPGPVLGGLVATLPNEAVGANPPPAIFPSLIPGLDDLDCLSRTLGGLFVEGVDIKWPETPPALAARHLAPYPFQRRSYWWTPAKHAERKNSARACFFRPEDGEDALNKGEVGLTPDLAETLRNIWEKWLPVNGFEAAADFFTLGGNSLIAAQIVMEIRRKLDPDFSMASLLQNTSLKRLEACLHSKPFEDKASWHSLPEIKADREGRYLPFPLNDMQYAYWIGRRNYFDAGEIGIHVYFEVDKKDLDMERFRQAWHKLLLRHDMLHCIVEENGEQRVLEVLPPYSVPETDLRKLEAKARAQALLQTRNELAHKLFDLAVWPQFDVRVHHLPGGLSRIHFAIDGWCVDGWSYQVLFNDLNWFYEHSNQDLPELPFTFRDYVLATLELEKSKAWEADRAYWTNRLGTLPMAPVLPLRPVKASSGSKPEFKRRECLIKAEKWARIKKQARQTGISTASVILSVYADTLSLWAAEPHFCINVPRFNRLPMHQEVDKVIGEFASFTLLEVERLGGQSFLDFARAIQGQMWRDLDHSLFSGVKVLRELAQVRPVPKSGAMPYVFTMAPEQIQNGRVESMISATNRLGQMEYMLTETPQVWIDCQYSEDNGAVRISWDSLDEYFPQGMVDAMFESFFTALSSLARNPKTWNTENLVFMPEEQAARRKKSNATARPVPSEDLFTLFTRRVESKPEAPALICSGACLSYAELYRLVEGLASLLMEKGVKPGDRVAICQKKGWEQIASVFAVLAAGAAYVPLDPKIPSLRMEAILRDAGAALVLTSEGSPDMPVGDKIPEVFFVNEAAVLKKTSATLPARQQGDLAYLIYTSGSTGTPKGVMISDRSVVNMLNDTNERFGIGPGDRLFGVTSLHHDLSVYDVFGALCGGAALVLPGPDDDRNAAAWLDLLHKEKITFWNSVPAVMEMLMTVAEEGQGLGNSLRLVILGGDWIPVKLPARLRALAPGAQLYTIGGPTETTVWNIFHHATEANDKRTHIPYGTPAGNSAYYIRDFLDRERPDYAVGEMHCAGEGVALGYWNDPERSSKSFFWDKATGLRLYATGDLGYWDADGEIRFSGRNDGQVKINGMRIETAEIESALARNAAVGEAAVIVDKAQKLVAFVTAVKTESAWNAVFDEAMEVAVNAYGNEWENWQRFHNFAEQAAIAAMQATLYQLAGSPPWSFKTLLSRYPEARRVEKPLQQWITRLSFEPDCPDSTEAALSLRDKYLDKLDGLAKAAPGEKDCFVVLAAYYRAAMRAQADILTGQADPLESLFPGGSGEVSEAIYNNIVSARCLHAGLGKALREIAAKSGGGLAVAEIGAGSGSTTQAVLEALGEALGSYHFTDVSPWFLDKARERFSAVKGFTTGIFDLNKADKEQKLSNEPLDIILAVNSIHCAANLREALDNLYARLKEGGCLILLEMTRVDSQVMATTGLIDGFHSYEDFRTERLTPLLPCEDWLALLRESGFDAHAVCPETVEIGENIIIARRPAASLNQQELLGELKKCLPAHMVPSTIQILENLPLTPNGKVDRKALAALSPGPTRGRYYSPKNAIETRIVDICKEISPKLSIDANVNLFEAGLNSLQATKLAIKLGAAFSRSLPVTVVFEYPTLKALSRLFADEQAEDALDALEAARSRALKRRQRRRRVTDGVQARAL